MTLGYDVDMNAIPDLLHYDKSQLSLRPTKHLTPSRRTIEIADAMAATPKTKRTAQGKPKVSALNKRLGYRITAAERDFVWELTRG